MLPTNGATVPDLVRLSDGTPLISGGAFPTVVPYRGERTIGDLVEAGEYDWCSPLINDENFPQEREGDEEIIIEPLWLGYFVRSHAAMEIIYGHGARPANAAELLALGAQNPDLQRKRGKVVGLGQRWCRPPNGHMVPICLEGNKVERHASVFALDTGWKETWFATIRTQPELIYPPSR